MLKSISAKMIAATTLLVIACCGLFLSLNMVEHEAIYKRTVFNHLEALSENMVDDLVPLLAERDILAITTKLLDFEQYDNAKYVIVFDNEWRILQKYVAPSYMALLEDNLDLPPFDIRAVTPGVTILNGNLVSYKPIGDEAYVQGYLLVVNYYREPLNQSNYDLIISSMPVAVVILLCMVLLAFLFNRSMLAPLFRLTKFTESVDSSSDYHLRYECVGNDEISNLGNKINIMLSRIEAQNEKTAEYTTALEKMANYDVLTNLPNRKLFMELLSIEMSKVQRRSANLMVLFLDLDDFKGINDTLGHDAGDALLIKVSELIRTQLRKGDILARLGGDEFLVLLNDIPDDVLDMGVRIIERIIQTLESPIMVRDWEVQTGVSIGFADAISADYDYETIVRNADVAMYHAKESGRSNTYALFQQKLLDDSLRKGAIANALTKALTDNEFFVAYQAKVGHNAEVTGFEALIRWQSSALGFISPGEFIPVAERSGKITPLSQWVIKNVFADMPSLFETVGHPVVVSINISPHDIKEPTFIDYIVSQLADHEVDSSCIEFEITESAYLDNFEDADRFFRKLRELGFSIALDDFGTGYSSMSYLTRIEIDTLKIDQQFIRRLDDSPKDKLIVEAIIGLAHNLELNVCAEGVETIEQSNYLTHHGCQQLQGYYYSRPCALKNLAGAMNENAKRAAQ